MQYNADCLERVNRRPRSVAAAACRLKFSLTPEAAHCFRRLRDPVGASQPVVSDRQSVISATAPRLVHTMARLPRSDRRTRCRRCCQPKICSGPSRRRLRRKGLSGRGRRDRRRTRHHGVRRLAIHRGAGEIGVRTHPRNIAIKTQKAPANKLADAFMRDGGGCSDSP